MNNLSSIIFDVNLGLYAIQLIGLALTNINLILKSLAESSSLNRFPFTTSDITDRICLGIIETINLASLNLN